MCSTSCIKILLMNETIINKRNDKNNSGMSENKGKSRSGYWISGYAITAVSFLILHFLIELKVFDLIEEYKPLVRKITMTFFFIFLILLIGKLIERLVVMHSQSKGNRYNLVRITRLLTKLFVLIVVVSFLFQNWYTAAVSFGLLSLILGFALQVPISSFIAWLYIIFRTPFKVGDRIEINGFKGDVIGIDYLDTTLLEFSGNYLSNDRRSGRVVRFPNSMVLRSEVFNYSGPQSPFIWNETAIQIGYTSDLKFVEESLFEAAKNDLVERLPHLHTGTATHLDPAVYFRVNSYAWLEAVVSYPVLPTDTTLRRTNIIKRALLTLNAQPERVLFPEGAAR